MCIRDRPYGNESGVLATMEVSLEFGLVLNMDLDIILMAACWFVVSLNANCTLPVLPRPNVSPSFHGPMVSPFIVGIAFLFSAKVVIVEIWVFGRGLVIILM